MNRFIAGLFICGMLAGAAQAQVTLWHRGGAAPATGQAVSGGPATSPVTGAVDGAANGSMAAASGSYGVRTAGIAGSANLAHQVQAQTYNLHDIVFIIVSIAAQASTDEQLATERKTDKQDLQILQYLKLQREGLLKYNLKGETPDNLGMAFESERKADNQGTSERNDSFRTRIAAEVVDRKPNGNLVLEARQEFTKQGEKTTITLTGVVRPQDIQPDNIVYSYNVADADIRYSSEGPITDASRRGWLSKIFDKIWPF